MLTGQIYKKVAKMSKVLVESGEKTKIAKLFGVSRLTVLRALNGKTQSDLAKQIRATAVLRGGVETTNK